MYTLKEGSIVVEIPEDYTGFSQDDRNGSLFFLSGKVHRSNGPAISYPGDGESWYLCGRGHRTNGYAVMYDWHQKLFKGQWRIHDKRIAKKPKWF